MTTDCDTRWIDYDYKEEEVLGMGEEEESKNTELDKTNR